MCCENSCKKITKIEMYVRCNCQLLASQAANVPTLNLQDEQTKTSNRASKNQHLSAAQLASWPGGVVGWWHPLQWRLSLRGRVPSRKKDGEGKEETQEWGAVSLTPPCSHGTKFLTASATCRVFQWTYILLPPLRAEAQCNSKLLQEPSMAQCSPSSPLSSRSSGRRPSPRQRSWNFSRASSSSFTMP